MLIRWNVYTTAAKLVVVIFAVETVVTLIRQWRYMTTIAGDGDMDGECLAQLEIAFGAKIRKVARREYKQQPAEGLLLLRCHALRTVQLPSQFVECSRDGEFRVFLHGVPACLEVIPSATLLDPS
ncbi:hypothetical protein BKA62DRAFT_707205 [Auriculariales sp. MPI-PUGE-AT-0066]|nr:hypothetical protein BKA62DRAFT_707205 [Auriculariales sp. MPI-PUGE-AT-0066]